jgi:predicted ATP-grasp superfamily ATP-dependent carboligase
MSGILTIVGASARAAAHSAARAGYEPVAFDLFADADLAALCPATRIAQYPADFLAALAQAPDAPWLYTGGLENYPRLIGRMAELRPLLGNSAVSLRAVRNPRKLTKTLHAAGLQAPAMFTRHNISDRKWLVKPRRGSAGLGVRFAESGELDQPPRGAILQEYIDGECCSATYVAAGGRAVLLGATRQLVGRDWDVLPEFLYLGSIGPLVVEEDEQAKLIQIGEFIATEFRLVGLFGVDFIRAGSGLYPVEVNPRYTASVEVLERITGMPLLAWHVAACLRGELPCSSPPVSGYAGKAIAYAREPCRWIGSLPGLPADTWPELADIPQPGTRFQRGQPIATVFAAGTSASDVQRKLRSREQQVLASLVVPVST